MAFNINEFINNISDYGDLMSPAKFTIDILPRDTTLWKTEFGFTDTRFISFLAYTVDIPGISLSTDLIFLKGYGKVNEVPLRVVKSYCDIGFYLDENNSSFDFLHAWMNSVTNSDGRYYRSGSVNDTSFNEMSYPDKYYCDVIISWYGVNNKRKEIKLLDAFPLEVSGLNLDWGSQNTISSLSSTLTFRAMIISSSEDIV